MKNNTRYNIGDKNVAIIEDETLGVKYCIVVEIKEKMIINNKECFICEYDYGCIPFYITKEKYDKTDTAYFTEDKKLIESIPTLDIDLFDEDCDKTFEIALDVLQFTFENKSIEEYKSISQTIFNNIYE